MQSRADRYTFYLHPNDFLLCTVKTVEITVMGRKRNIQPVGQSWDEWFDNPGVSEDVNDIS